VANRFVTGPGIGCARSNKADDLRAARRGLMDFVDGVLQIFVGVGSGRHLYQSDGEFLRWHYSS
jgi:hypothetical protein